MPRLAFSLKPATIGDAAPLAVLHTAVANHLTEKFGTGPWSAATSEKGILFAMRTSQVYVARLGNEMVGTLRLQTKKPWAIDTSYFPACKKPLYLLAMAITPAKQRQGLGRECLEEIKSIAKAWPADALRLDAYDAKAGAGGFYSSCGWHETGRVTYRGVPLIYYHLPLV
jgi:GNAT superfamily N-acetyltransferase